MLDARRRAPAIVSVLGILACAAGAIGSFAALFVCVPSARAAVVIEGRVRDAESGRPVVGAMVSFRHGSPIHEVTVYSDAAGAFRSPGLASDDMQQVRVRRIGWRDARIELTSEAFASGAGPLDVVLERETEAGALADQLPANRWYALLLAQLRDPAEREELVRQCTFCHQQGSEATRRLRDEEEWRKLLSLMARMGAPLSPTLRERVPAIFNAAYEREAAVAVLTRDRDAPGFAPAPPPEVRRAVIEEWELGHRASMQHDLVVHPDGRIYSVDMTQDRLYALDPRTGHRDAFPVPRDDLPPGGVFSGATNPAPPNANAHVGPHSLQVAPDGSIWMTLALGNRLARFDPQSTDWKLVPLQEGFYPHTLRFDSRGRIWYTIAVSNHVGMYDPATREHRSLRVPAASLGQAVTLRLLPALMWLNRHLDLAEVAASAGEGVQMPVPYGIDVAPDGGIWFSQLNAHRIGRIDPESFDIEMIDTPFTGPRRLRFDAEGRLWVPGFSSGLISRFDPQTREFHSYELPIEPPGSDTPYALNVDRRSGQVWVCGTNSDTLLRFDPRSERFTVYPLPTRVTYTREIDFDAAGRVWTSNSNLPTWQIEGGFPRVLRLDTRGVDAGPASLPEEVALP